MQLSYTEFDAERMLPERHENRRRSDFARDRARILHSSALRRLSAKTQVLSPTAGVDFARNRLTHSLEVAQVGRELATALELDPDVVDTACLAHDLGHPPFGHNGEKALNDWASDIGGFEGNAQSLRLLVRLEAKVFGSDGTSYGLNLTRASLDASTKYPWAQELGVADSTGRNKFGVYQDDLAVFDWFRQGSPDGRRCIEAQVMDLSDDIAYSVHDFEDAIFGGFLSVTELNDPAERSLILAEMLAWNGSEFSADELDAAWHRLAENELWLSAWQGSRYDQAKLKNLTSQFIGRFAQSTIAATRAHYEQQSMVRYQADVIIPREVAAEIAVLKGIVAAFVMTNTQRQPLYIRQRNLLTELANELYRLGDSALDAAFVSDWELAESDETKKRVILDQIASLTDQSAMTWHDRYCQ